MTAFESGGMISPESRRMLAILGGRGGVGYTTQMIFDQTADGAGFASNLQAALLETGRSAEVSVIPDIGYIRVRAPVLLPFPDARTKGESDGPQISTHRVGELDVVLAPTGVRALRVLPLGLPQGESLFPWPEITIHFDRRERDGDVLLREAALYIARDPDAPAFRGVYRPSPDELARSADVLRGVHGRVVVESSVVTAEMTELAAQFAQSQEPYFAKLLVQRAAELQEQGYAVVVSRPNPSNGRSTVRMIYPVDYDRLVMFKAVFGPTSQLISHSQDVFMICPLPWSTAA